MPSCDHLEELGVDLSSSCCVKCPCFVANELGNKLLVKQVNTIKVFLGKMLF